MQWQGIAAAGATVWTAPAAWCVAVYAMVLESIDKIPLLVTAQTTVEEETELPPLDLELFFWLFTHSVQTEH